MLLGGCSLDVAFKQDLRVKIVAPADRSTVELPFEIRWKVKDFTITRRDGLRAGDGGFFALFVDRSPIAPGKDLRSVAEDDKSCLSNPRCPDEEYLNQRNVFTTTKTVYPVKAIADSRPPERPETKDEHEVTLVLIDPAGKRIGDSAFSVEFIVERSTGPEF